MSDRAERKRKRKVFIDIVVKKFGDRLKIYQDYNKAVDLMEEDAQKLITCNPRDKEFYEQCYSEAEDRIWNITKDFLEREKRYKELCNIEKRKIKL